MNDYKLAFLLLQTDVVWAANNCDFRHVAVLGRLFTHHGGAYTNTACHPSRVGKWGPASAEKAKASMVHSIRGKTRGLYR